MYVFDINAISKNANRRNKRLFDVALSFLLLAAFPIMVFLVRNRVGLLRNIFRVLAGRFSWVGFYPNAHQKLPPVKPGIVHPGDALPKPEQKADTFAKLNVVYAKDYHVRTDLRLIAVARHLLGRQPLAR